MADAKDELAAKTALGILDWRPEWVIGQHRLPECKIDAGLTDMSPADAAKAGAKTFVIGAVNPGGTIPDHWLESIFAALDAGLDVANGMHMRLTQIPEIADRANNLGRSLFDVRHADRTFKTGSGVKRSGMRLLTVGTDCSVGKKYTSLAIDQEMRKRGHKSDFRATGQTGVLISGRGVSLDAVPADFISGAAEWISPENDEDHWDIVEGQGSLFHPSFAGVTLGLLHGAQPDAFVVCHEPTRTNVRNVAHPVPSIAEVIELTIMNGKLTNPNIRPVGIAVNTSALGENEAQAFLTKTRNDYDLPATDPVRFGTANIVDHLEEIYGLK